VTTGNDSSAWPALMARLPSSWVESCSRVMGASQGLAERWLASRAEQARLTADAVGQLSACRNPQEAVAIHHRWLAQTVERLSAEVMHYRIQASVISLQSLTAFANGHPGRSPEPGA